MLKGLLEVEVRGVEKDLIPNVGQLVLTNVPIKWWIIDPYINSLLDSLNKGVWLPTHNAETVQPGMMTWGLPKGLCRLPYVPKETALGLCGVVFMIAFDFKSIKGPVGILVP